MIKKVKMIMISLLLVMITACQNKRELKIERTIFAMDTSIHIEIYGQDDESLLDDVEEEIMHLEKLFSTTKKESQIYQINHRSSQTIHIDQETAEVLQYTLNLSKETNGALDPTIYPAVLGWGFTTDEYHILSQNDIQQLQSIVGYQKIQLNNQTLTMQENMLLDLGAIVKGYTGDIICELLKEKGVKSALINLGGNVQTLGQKNNQNWKVGIYSPLSQDDFAVLEVHDQAIVTSGLYERYFVGEDGKIYGHIIDPQTLKPVENEIVSLTIISPKGKQCDGLSTALFVMGKDKAIEFYQARNDFEFVLLTKEKVYISEGIENIFSLRDNHDMKVEVIKR